MHREEIRPKVLHMATIDYTIDKLLLDKLCYLRSYGYDIALASSRGRYTHKINNAGFSFQPIKIERTINPFKDILSIYKTYKYLRKEKFTIVHTHTAKAGFIGRVAAKLARVPVIIHTSHGLPFYEGQNKIKHALYLILERLACNLSDYVFSQNWEGIDKMKMYRFKPRYGIGYEGNGIDTVKLDKELRSFDRCKKLEELGLEDSSIIIGYYARLEPVKGHMLFLKALKQLLKKCDRIVCLIAGKGFLEYRIREYIKRNNMEKNVKLLGFREDIHEIISVTDIVVLASEKEGIPRILMEGMYLKKPVVATNVTGTRELVVHGKTGLLAEYGDAEALEACMKELVQDNHLRRAMGMAGHERIKQEFAERIVAERINSIYKYILAKKGITASK